MAEEKKKESPEFMELVKFLVKPLDDLKAEMRSHQEGVFAQFSEMKKGMQAMNDDFCSLAKKIEQMEGECNKNRSLVGKVQNEIHDLPQVRDSISQSKAEISELFRKVSDIPSLGSRLSKMEEELPSLLKSLQDVVKKHSEDYERNRELADKALHHSQDNEKQLKSVEQQCISDARALRESISASAGLIGRNHEEVVEKIAQANKHSDSYRKAAQQDLKEVQIDLAAQIQGQKEAHHDVMKKISDLGIKLDREVEPLKFFQKRFDIMEKRVENCFHLVKEIRVHLNI